MAKTYEPIATSTLGSAASSITFSSIPNTYTDLRLVVVAKAEVAALLKVFLNSDTSNSYSGTMLLGTGSAAASFRYTSNSGWYLYYSNTLSTSQFEMYTFDIFSYTGSTYKTALGTRSNDYNGSGEVYTGAFLYQSTSAINTIDVSLIGQNFAVGTRATIYGIKKA